MDSTPTVDQDHKARGQLLNGFVYVLSTYVNQRKDINKICLTYRNYGLLVDFYRLKGRWKLLRNEGQWMRNGEQLVWEEDVSTLYMYDACIWTLIACCSKTVCMYI